MLSRILDLIFPIECVGCGEDGKWLCDYCFSKIEFNEYQICPLCGQKIKEGFSCKCSLNHYIDIYITFLNLKKNPAAADLIYKLKYNFVENISEELAKIGCEFLSRCIKKDNILSYILSDNDIIFIPVPLHKKRFLWRGFNQSKLILEKIADKSGQEFARFKFDLDGGILCRIKNTSFQGKNKMPKNDRKENMRGAFEAKCSLEGKTIILFDDVITTGATMEECARVLKEKGAKMVVGMGIGRPQ